MQEECSLLVDDQSDLRFLELYLEGVGVGDIPLVLLELADRLQDLVLVELVVRQHVDDGIFRYGFWGFAFKRRPVLRDDIKMPWV